MPVSKKKKSRRSDGFKPFNGLKAMIEKKSVKLAAMPSDAYFQPVAIDPGIEDEHELFISAMDDVTPISHDKHFEIDHNPELPNGPAVGNDESEELKRLENLVKYGEGFVIADTPEYIEGTAHEINPEIIKRLHRGDYTIQAFIDLHGLGVRDALEKFGEFMKDAIRTAKSGVLIVHGRGLSSPRKPVLKTKVQEWLTSGPWRKWVVAYSSARSCDGGTGATYVLLGRKPLAKKRKKRHRGKKTNGCN